MIVIKLLGYILAAYGIANMIVYSNGPFKIFDWWRRFSMGIHKNFGELFTCMMCISTWIGLFLSLIDIFLIPNIEITPFNIIFNNSHYVLTVILDMGFTSGIVWLIHQLEEMMERTGDVFYEE